MTTERDPLDRICRFPKHAGKTWREVCEEDVEYIDWLLSDGPAIDEDLYDALMDWREE